MAEAVPVAVACECGKWMAVSFGVGLGVGIFLGIALSNREYRDLLVQIARDLGMAVSEFLSQIYSTSRSYSRYRPVPA